MCEDCSRKLNKKFNTKHVKMMPRVETCSICEERRYVDEYDFLMITKPSEIDKLRIEMLIDEVNDLKKQIKEMNDFRLQVEKILKIDK